MSEPTKPDEVQRLQQALSTFAGRVATAKSLQDVNKAGERMKSELRKQK